MIERLSITVVGTVRDCEKSIRSEYQCFKSILGGAKQLNFFIVESDSSDNSVIELEKLRAKDEHFDFISQGNLSSELPIRTERIAFCRNKYLEELRANPKYADTDYIIVSDLDGMNSLLTREAMRSCWEFNSWDVCTANQVGKYYDVYALRHPLWSPNDCWEQYLFYTEELQMLSPIAQRKTIGARQIHIPRSSDPIEVDSAFGGLGIYKKKVIENARYIGLTDEGEEICEHLAFHWSIRSNGCRIFINPKLINCKAPRQHILNSPAENVKYALAYYAPGIYKVLQKKFGELGKSNP